MELPSHRSQIAQCPERWSRRSCTRTTTKKTHTLLSIVTNSQAQRFIQDTDAPLHDESVIAVRDKFLDASDDEVSDEDGYLSRSMTIKAYNKLVKGVCVDEAYRDSLHVTVHVPAETKDSIDKEPLTKMPKSTTPINAARPNMVHEARDAHAHPEQHVNSMRDGDRMVYRECKRRQ